MAATVKYNPKKHTFAGTNKNDMSDAALSGYEPTENAKDGNIKVEVL